MDVIKGNTAFDMALFLGDDQQFNIFPALINQVGRPQEIGQAFTRPRVPQEQDRSTAIDGTTRVERLWTEEFGIAQP
jgi:hypothetical protein